MDKLEIGLLLLYDINYQHFINQFLLYLDFIIHLQQNYKNNCHTFQEQDCLSLFNVYYHFPHLLIIASSISVSCIKALPKYCTWGPLQRLGCVTHRLAAHNLRNKTLPKNGSQPASPWPPWNETHLHESPPCLSCS